MDLDTEYPLAKKRIRKRARRKRDDKLNCKVCGKRLRSINNTHLKTHGITVEEYKELYPYHHTISRTTRLMRKRLRKTKE